MSDHHAPDGGHDIATVLDPSAPTAMVLQAAAHLVDVPTPTWARMADDAAYSVLHRRIALFELFRRHVHAGATAGEIAQLLDVPAWLEDADIRALGDIGGRPPAVSMTAQDTVVAIDMLPGHEPVHPLWSVYLRLGGTIERSALSALLRGMAPRSAVSDAVVLEIGFLPSRQEIAAIVLQASRHA